MADVDYREMRCCDECGSDYVTATSRMVQLCSECAHRLYGYPRCPHAFERDRCSRCGWNASVSVYLRGMQTHCGEPAAEPGAAPDGVEKRRQKPFLDR